ncbi:MAG: hypothetical protein RR642_16305, partial [Solibacillus sp.]
TQPQVKIETTFDVMESSKASEVYSGFYSYSVGEPIVFLGGNAHETYTWTKVDNLTHTLVKTWRK